MKKLIIEYLKESIETKKMIKKDLNRIDEVVKTLAETQAEMFMLIEEHKNESYKEKFLKEHKKFKEYEKEAKNIIEIFKKQSIESEKELNALRKEVKKYAKNS